MSFKLGAFDTNSIPGFKAILREWPSTPANVKFEELPAGDGSLFLSARMESTDWEFDLELRGSDIDEVMSQADAISKALNPLIVGEANFTPNAFEGWVWKGILNGGIDWKRDKVVWFSSEGVCILRGRITVTTANPYGKKVGAKHTLAAPGTVSLAPVGNAGAYPVVTFRGVLSAAQEFTYDGVRVFGPLTAAQSLVLDFGNMEFFVRTGTAGAKVRDVADRLSNFSRLIYHGPKNVLMGVTAGTFTEASVTLHSRRI